MKNHRQFREFLEHRVGNSSEAEDILQAAFLRSVEKGGTIRNDETVVAWFYRLLRNALIDHYRHRGAENRALALAAGMASDGEEPEPVVGRAICQCINDLLPTLKESYAALLRRVDIEGSSIADVAAETGMTPNNVRVKLHRARSALRKQLELCSGACTEHGCLDCTCRQSPGHRD